MDKCRYGIALTIRGYNNKQPVFAQRLMEHLIQFKPDPARFEVLKEVGFIVLLKREWFVWTFWMWLLLN